MNYILYHLITHILTLSHTLSLSHVLPCLSLCLSVSLYLCLSLSHSFLICLYIYVFLPKDNPTYFSLSLTIVIKLNLCVILFVFLFYKSQFPLFKSSLQSLYRIVYRFAEAYNSQNVFKNRSIHITKGLFSPNNVTLEYYLNLIIETNQHI